MGEEEEEGRRGRGKHRAGTTTAYGTGPSKAAAGGRCRRVRRLGAAGWLGTWAGGVTTTGQAPQVGAGGRRAAVGGAGPLRPASTSSAATLGKVRTLSCGGGKHPSQHPFMLHSLPERVWRGLLQLLAPRARGTPPAAAPPPPLISSAPAFFSSSTASLEHENWSPQYSDPPA